MPGQLLRIDVGDRDHYMSGHDYFHRVIVTRVPLPGALSISKSFTSRFAPDNPSPIPVPEVHPSFIASDKSAIPGPWSLNVSRNPRRVTHRSRAPNPRRSRD